MAESFAVTESFACRTDNESMFTIESFWNIESRDGADIVSGPFCAKETPAEIIKLKAKKINRFK
jgi:hypothetical protein